MERSSLWQDVESLSAQITLPWLLGGDFNTTMSFGERMTGGELVDAETNELVNIASICKLQDMRYSRQLYTWCNNQEGLERRYCKLDMPLINEKWLDLLPRVATSFIHHAISDHAYALVQFGEYKKPHHSFKYCEM